MRDFVLIACQDREAAERVSAATYDNPWIRVVHVGELFCGLHRHGVRPNILVRAYKATTQQHIQWENEILRPSLRHAATII